MQKELDEYQISAAQSNDHERGEKRMLEKPPNTTRLTDKLCEKRLIERVRSEEDRRALYVSIRSSGLNLLSRIKFEGAPNHMQNVSEKEIGILNDLLDKIRG